MNSLSKQIKQINGPVNVVRLEGKFNSITKILYVFMDFHVPVSFETVCDNIFRKDIEEYFAESFYNLNSTNKIYDFFLETWDMEFDNINYGLHYKSNKNYKGMYIEEVIKLFRKLFVFDPKSKKVRSSKLFKNIRLHYLDIRVFFEKSFYFDFYDMIYLANMMRINIYINTSDLKVIINFLKKFVEYCHFIEDIINEVKSSNGKKKLKKINIIEFNKNITNESEKIQKQKYYELFYYLLNKMYWSYKYDNVKQFARDEINTIIDNLSDLITSSENAILKFENILNTINSVNGDLYKDPASGRYFYGLTLEAMHEMCATVYLELNRISENLRYYFINFMDIYFIRRFLDNDYITNAIAYTGAAHSIVYIDILCKKFGFVVTHAYYSKIPDLKILNSKIKKMDDLEILFFPPVLAQCSDMTNFPENFA